MSIEIKWIIESLEVKPVEGDKTDVVVNAAWRCLATNGVENSSNYSTCTFDAPGDVFTPYAKLTQDQVLEWVWKIVDRAETESIVSQKINDQVNPPSIKRALPWVDPAQEVK